MTTELTAVLDRYLDALLAHEPSRLPLTAATRITENGYPIQLGHGLFETASAITHRHDVVDDATGQIATFGAVRESLLHANFWVRPAGVIFLARHVTRPGGRSSYLQNPKTRGNQP